MALMLVRRSIALRTTISIYVRSLHCWYNETSNRVDNSLDQAWNTILYNVEWNGCQDWLFKLIAARIWFTKCTSTGARYKLHRFSRDISFPVSLEATTVSTVSKTLIAPRDAFLLQQPCWRVWISLLRCTKGCDLFKSIWRATWELISDEPSKLSGEPRSIARRAQSRQSLAGASISRRRLFAPPEAVAHSTPVTPCSPRYAPLWRDIHRVNQIAVVVAAIIPGPDRHPYQLDAEELTPSRLAYARILSMSGLCA